MILFIDIRTETQSDEEMFLYILPYASEFKLYRNFELVQNLRAADARLLEYMR